MHVKPLKPEYMIKTLSLVLLLAITTAAGAQSTNTIDPAGSKLVWTGKKITGQHHGSIDVKSGTIGWGENGLVQAEVTIDMTSITDLDMEREYAAELEAQLRSTDFFNTAEFRTAAFKTTRVDPIPGVEAGKPNYSITGDLSIKGITHPVTFDVMAWKEKKGIRAAGTIAFDRTLYGIKYRSGKFYDTLGDKMIEDMVQLTFDVKCK